MARRCEQGLIQAFDETFLCEHWTGWRRSVAATAGITAAHPGAPLDWRLSFLDRVLALSARSKVWAWPTERVVIAHGEWAREDGQAYLVRALKWLGPS